MSGPGRVWRPSKGRGQNFLVDQNLARKLVAALEAGPGDTVLEIGPGKGALTEPLLATGCKVVAVEVEGALAEALEARGLERLEVVHADVLAADLFELAARVGPGVKVLSNVPYSITGPLLTRVLSGALDVSRLVVGVQKEVADRMVATPGGRDFGTLSVWVRAFGEAKRLFKIPPSAYRPRPRVQSAAVRVDRVEGRAPLVRGGLLERVVRAGFGQRRKALRNSLRGGLALAAGVAEEALEAAGVDPMARAETVDVEGWRRLAEALGPHLDSAAE